MTDEKSKRVFVTPSDPPNPLDFPVKDPLRETYEGRWRRLPLIQKVGVTVVLGFWVLFIAAMVWGEGIGTLAPIALVATILGAVVLLLRKRGQ